MVNAPWRRGGNTWPIAVRAQQPTMPVVGLIFGGSVSDSARYLVVTVEYHWLENHSILPALAAALVRQQVAVVVATATLRLRS